ncbi:hypothetical protein BaRGS_00005582 [Batillaria attramentaria]|uniref:Uncharacterized protein n=1 Tax=Batillaria attramentaria TaxID=370345 RepID=A0ABD0LVC8_9CAEN
MHEFSYFTSRTDKRTELILQGLPPSPVTGCPTRPRNSMHQKIPRSLNALYKWVTEYRPSPALQNMSRFAKAADFQGSSEASRKYRRLYKILTAPRVRPATHWLSQLRGGGNFPSATAFYLATRVPSDGWLLSCVARFQYLTT